MPASKPSSAEVVLASTSPYRRAQLVRLGLEVTAEAPGVDEEQVKAEGLTPVALAEKLALAKAEAVAARMPGAIVIGGDQLVEIDGRILGKPGTRERAVEQLLTLSGRVHSLVTAMVVVAQGNLHRHTDVTRLHMRSLERAELERYVDQDRPFDCAGSYRLESRGIALFSRIETEDWTAIVGLPLIALVSILRSVGHPVL